MKITSTATKTLAALLLAGSLAGCDTLAQTGIEDYEAIEVIESLPAIPELTELPAVPAAPAPAAAPQAPAAPAAGEAANALAQLNTIPIKGRAPKTGYSRDEFGPAWADVDRNGCDTRNDILARDREGETFKPGTKNCVVLTGTLADKYTGKTIEFERGQKTSTLVQIDHVIALSDAWQKGAQQLTPAQRQELANDPLNLWATDGPTNSAKSDKDAATWLPPNKPFRCEYVARQTAVKAKYNLWVTQAEHDAIAGILATCN